MSKEEFDRSKYDVVSVSRKGSEKKANYVKDGYCIDGTGKSSGQFVKVVADVFLKKETGDRYYF